MTDRITQTEHDITQIYIQTKSWVRDLKKRVTELEKEVIKLNDEIHQPDSVKKKLAKINHYESLGLMIRASSSASKHWEQIKEKLPVDLAILMILAGESLDGRTSVMKIKEIASKSGLGVSWTKERINRMERLGCLISSQKGLTKSYRLNIYEPCDEHFLDNK